MAACCSLARRCLRLRGSDPRALLGERVLERRHRAKMYEFIYIGEMCRFLVNTPPSAGDRAHGICFCLGNGLRPDIFATFQQRFGIPRVIEFYGATEGNTALFNLDLHPGSVGRMPFWAAKRFPIKIVAYDVETNTQKRDAAGPLHRMRRRRSGRTYRRDPR